MSWKSGLFSRVLARSQVWGSAWRVALSRATGVEIASGCCLSAGCDVQLGFALPRRGRIALGRRCILDSGVILRPYGGQIVLGEDVYLGPGVVVFGHGGVEIGSSTLVSMHCRILSSNHAIPPQCTDIRSLPDILLPTKIGRDVWLGAGVTVVGGVTIGDGCVVGAGAVVTADLPPYSVAAGVPAHILRQRQ